LDSVETTITPHDVCAGTGFPAGGADFLVSVAPPRIVIPGKGFLPGPLLVPVVEPAPVPAADPTPGPRPVPVPTLGESLSFPAPPPVPVVAVADGAVFPASVFADGDAVPLPIAAVEAGVPS